MLIRSAVAICTKGVDHSLLKTPYSLGFGDMPLSCVSSSPLTTAPSLLWNLVPLLLSRCQISQVSVLAHYCSHRTSLPGRSSTFNNADHFQTSPIHVENYLLDISTWMSLRHLKPDLSKMELVSFTSVKPCNNYYIRN